MRAIIPVLLLCLLCCAGLSHGQRRPIERLPRLNFHPNFKQYSGYLSTGTRRLFYWLVESSEVNPAVAPLVLWLNGGPGCSSVGGMLMTNGPFLANDRAELDRNPMAWNRIANVLYIDSPSGVGLSEPGHPSEKLDDETATMLNMMALMHFYSLFPEYHGRPFYIAGESYAGIYIPLLAQEIRKSKDVWKYEYVINLRGIAIGNGLLVPTSHPSLSQSRQHMAELMGLISDVSDDDFWRPNCGSKNCYNVAKPCLSQEPNRDTYSCLNSTGLVTYLNDKEVRHLLGVDESISADYKICPYEINRNYKTCENGTLDVIKELAVKKGDKRRIKVLLYHGTLDLLIPVNVTKNLVRTLPPVEFDTSYEPWFYWANDSGRISKQAGGIEQKYMDGAIRFRTVVGAGHSVATDRPEMGFQIFTDFLKF